MWVIEWLMKWRVVDWIKFLIADGMTGEGLSDWLNEIEILMSDALLRVVVIDGLSECDVSWYKSDEWGVGGGGN